MPDSKISLPVLNKYDTSMNPCAGQEQEEGSAKHRQMKTGAHQKSIFLTK